jgi:hypothetical protein
MSRVSSRPEKPRGQMPENAGLRHLANYYLNHFHIAAASTREWHLVDLEFSIVYPRDGKIDHTQINFYRIQAISLAIARRVPLAPLLPLLVSRGCGWVQCHFITRNCWSRSIRELTRHSSFPSPLQREILSAAKRSRPLRNVAESQPSGSDHHLKPAIEPACKETHSSR